MKSSFQYQYFVRLPALLLITVLLYMGVFSKRGFRDLTRMRNHNAELSLGIKKAKAERDRLTKRIQGLKESVSEQERTIRQVLGYVRVDETILEFQ